MKISWRQIVEDYTKFYGRLRRITNTNSCELMADGDFIHKPNPLLIQVSLISDPKLDPNLNYNINIKAKALKNLLFLGSTPNK